MILTVEHTSGGKECHCCHRPQEFVTQCNYPAEPINLKFHRPPTYDSDGISRVRLCAQCAQILLNDLQRAIEGEPDSENNHPSNTE